MLCIAQCVHLAPCHPINDVLRDWPHVMHWARHSIWPQSHPGLLPWSKRTRTSMKSWLQIETFLAACVDGAAKAAKRTAVSVCCHNRIQEVPQHAHQDADMKHVGPSLLCSIQSHICNYCNHTSTRKLVASCMARAITWLACSKAGQDVFHNRLSYNLSCASAKRDAAVPGHYKKARSKWQSMMPGH